QGWPSRGPPPAWCHGRRPSRNRGHLRTSADLRPRVVSGASGSFAIGGTGWARARESRMQRDGHFVAKRMPVASESVGPHHLPSERGCLGGVERDPSAACNRLNVRESVPKPPDRGGDGEGFGRRSHNQGLNV